MKSYRIPLVPGPASVPERVRRVYLEDYGSGDMEPEFAELYLATEARLQTIAGTTNRVVIMTGEGMLALWGALNSVIRPGDPVVAVATGLFGYGIGDMASGLGAEVTTVGFEYDETIHDWERVRRVLREVRPTLVTAVHCETPSGTLNPVKELGRVIREELGDETLFYVDAVASLAGCPVEVDASGIDLALFGTQKALSAPPELAMVSVSERAWERVAHVGYQGYDALQPWRDVGDPGSFPYTPAWASVAALNEACAMVLEEGLENVYARHARVTAQTRQGLDEQGIRLYPSPSAVAAPTVTAALVPAGWTWEAFDGALRERGLVVGGSWGKLYGKVFRIGHMGTQADEGLVAEALEVIQKVLAS
ncbi:MAG: aminotransferase class V-fold PLP-dependent enzyme [Chloroflexota bacterium]|nr:aminotransferase class V-fold PLP-dependent enzyme [Chloroflexota bacterium]